MFKGCHFPKPVILTCIRWYLRFKLSYLDLEEMMAERGVAVDHATINRWVLKFAPMLAFRPGVTRSRSARAFRRHAPTPDEVAVLTQQVTLMVGCTPQ